MHFSLVLYYKSYMSKLRVLVLMNWNIHNYIHFIYLYMYMQSKSFKTGAKDIFQIVN